MNLFFREVYEVTGYTRSGATYCVNCLSEEDSDGTIFLGDEWDYEPTCDMCGEKIEVSVIDVE